MPSTQVQSTREMFDQAVTLLQTQPEAACSIFRSLAGTDDESIGYAAGEQYINALWALGRLDEVEKEAERLMKQIQKNPDQSYLWARVTLRWAEAKVAGGQEDKAAKELEKAQHIFEINADYYNVGKIEQLKGAISAAKGDFGKAQKQLMLGRRLTSVHLSTIIPEPARTATTPELAGAGSLN